MTRELAQKVLAVVDAGLVCGIGKPIAGQMCVEAAVCYAMGLPHSDEPKCVGAAVRSFKIRLNDSKWPTDADRTKGMRKLAVAQLGSDAINQMTFAKHVALECQRRVLPLMLRHAASFKNKFSDELDAAALVCEASTTHEEAKAAALAACEVTQRANACDYLYACAYSYSYANANANANANAYVSTNAYAYAYSNANAAIRLQILNLFAQIGLEALIACKSPGCEWLGLCADPVAVAP